MRRQITLFLVFACAISIGANDKGHSQNSSARSVAVVDGPPVKISLPVSEGSLRFAVIGDTGTGSKQQQQLADVMTRYKTAFPFEFVLMTGDNMYGGETPADFKRKFSDVYKALLDDRVLFYASLGNHDESTQRFYEHFNMKGEEYYRLKKRDVAFYALNSNYMEKRQLKWLEDELAKDESRWKIVFLHHPLYSSGGKHGSSSGLREVVEPILLKHGVNVVFAGHDHFYERIKPQRGIYHFVSGAGGKLRRGDVKKGSPLTALAYDTDMSFMLIEIAGDQLHFQVISRTGETVDTGVLPNQRPKS
jgi:hypothetical protein